MCLTIYIFAATSYNHAYKNLGIHRINRIVKASLADKPYITPEAIRISNPIADTFREIKCHPTQKIEEDCDADIILTAEEVARWVLANAPNLYVIEPQELKEFTLKIIEE